MSATGDVQFPLNSNNEKRILIFLFLTGHDKIFSVAFCSKTGDQIQVSSYPYTVYLLPQNNLLGA